jgi:hypothetical protein
VNYSIQDGSAQAGRDFTAAFGTLKFAAGETAKTITIHLAPTDHFVGTRSAEVVLSNPQGVTLGYPKGILNLTSTPVAVKPPATNSLTPASTSAPLPTGPTVESIETASHGNSVTTVTITFDRALDAASALKLVNYHVSLPDHTLRILRLHKSITHPGRSIRITKAAYDPSTHRVTLTLAGGVRLGQPFQVQINGTAAGVIDTKGIPLNNSGSSKPGADYVASVVQKTQRPHH